MARITVEDCLPTVQDRFELVMLAAKRTREIAMGAQPCIDRRNDKDDVTALREIAAGYLDVNELRKRYLYYSHNLPYIGQEDDESDLELLDGFEANPLEYAASESTDEEDKKKIRVDDKAI